MAAPDQIKAIRERGYTVLRGHLEPALIDACRRAFWPELEKFLAGCAPEGNRGPHRYFLPMPFHPPCFDPAFFFHPAVQEIVHGVMDDRVVADQWNCDVPVRGSEHQNWHVDYQRPLFSEAPDLPLPPYALVMSFGLVPIGAASGPMELAPGTHRMPRQDAMAAVQAGRLPVEAVALEIGDVLLRHPWVLHRGSPNRTATPRALASIRYVRRWYWDDSREVDAMPRAVWEALTVEQRQAMRFPVGG